MDSLIKNRIFDKNWILVQIFENNQLKIDPRQNLQTGVREFTSVNSKEDWIFIFWISNFGGSKISFFLQILITSNKFRKFSIARKIQIFRPKFINSLFLLFSKTVKTLVFGSTIFKGCFKGVSNGICMFTYNFISILWFRPMSEFIISVSFRKFWQRILFFANKKFQFFFSFRNSKNFNVVKRG